MSGSFDHFWLPLVVEYLSLGDIKALKLVCKGWDSALSIPRYFKNSIVNLTGTLISWQATNQSLEVQYEYLNNSQVMQIVQSLCFRNVEIKAGDLNNKFWTSFGPQIKSLKFEMVVFESDSELEHILSLCGNLTELLFENCASYADNTEQSRVPFVLQSLRRLSFIKSNLSKSMYQQLQESTGPLQSLEFDHCYVSCRDHVEVNLFQLMPAPPNHDQCSVNIAPPFILHHSLSLSGLALSNMGHVKGLSPATVLKTDGLSLKKFHFKERMAIRIPEPPLDWLWTSHQQVVKDLAIDSLPLHRRSLMHIRHGFPALSRLSVILNSSDVHYVLDWLHEQKGLEYLKMTVSKDARNRNTELSFNLPDSLRVLKCSGLHHTLTGVHLQAPAFPLHLTELQLRCPQMVDDTLVQNICKWLRELRILDLSDCSELSDAGVTGISQTGTPSDSDNGERFQISCLRNLKQLNLSDCYKLTDKSLIHGLTSMELKELNISNCFLITDEGIRDLGKRIPSLEVLMLRYCDISNEGLSTLLKGTPRLRALNVESCKRLSIECIESIAISCPLMRSLTISGFNSKDAFVRLKNKLPRCSIIDENQLKKFPRPLGVHMHSMSVIGFVYDSDQDDDDDDGDMDLEEVVREGQGERLQQLVDEGRLEEMADENGMVRLVVDEDEDAVLDREQLVRGGWGVRFGGMVGEDQGVRLERVVGEDGMVRLQLRANEDVNVEPQEDDVEGVDLEHVI